MDDFQLFQDFVVNASLPDPPNLMQIILFVTYVKFVVVAFFVYCIKTWLYEAIKTLQGFQPSFRVVVV